MKKNDIIGEIITEKKDIEKNGCYTVAFVNWDIEKMSNDEILKKMYKIFIETF